MRHCARLWLMYTRPTTDIIIYVRRLSPRTYYRYYRYKTVRKIVFLPQHLQIVCESKRFLFDLRSRAPIRKNVISVFQTFFFTLLVYRLCVRPTRSLWVFFPFSLNWLYTQDENTVFFHTIYIYVYSYMSLYIYFVYKQHDECVTCSDEYAHLQHVLLFEKNVHIKNHHRKNSLVQNNIMSSYRNRRMIIIVIVLKINDFSKRIF